MAAQSNGFHSIPVPVMLSPLTPTQAIPEAPPVKALPKGIYRKLAAVYAEARYVQKDRKNTFHNYTYASEAAIKDKLHEAFTANGIVLLPYEILELVETEPAPKKDDRETKGGQFLTTIKVKFTLVDVDSGEQITGTSYGRGQDNADKGIYKALTGALKYFLTTTFMIATGDDPEADAPTETQQPKPRQQGNRRAEAPVAIPAPKPAAVETQASPVSPEPVPMTIGAWTGRTRAERLAELTAAQQELPADIFHKILERHGAAQPSDFSSANKAYRCYLDLFAAVVAYRKLAGDARTYENFEGGA